MKRPTLETKPQAGPIASMLRGFRDFWFAPGDPTVLGFIRICTGLVLLYILLCSGPLLSSFYGPEAWIDAPMGDMLRNEMPWMPPHTDWDEDTPYKVIRPEARNVPGAFEIWRHWGVDPAYTLETGQPFFSPYFHLTTPTQLYVAHGLALLIAALFTLGVGTRVTAVLAWVVGLSYIHRIPAALFGMDTMLGILLLYLMIGPSGAALSVDRLILKWHYRRQGLTPPEVEPSVMATFVTRLLQVHFCVMYFIAGASKLQGAAWWNGTAIWQTLTNYEFAPAKFDAFTGMLRALTVNRWVWELVHTSAAWGTVALEIGLPFLIWHRRTRWLFIVASVGMHTFIALTMGLTAFSMLMVCILFAFIPPEQLKAALTWAGDLAARLRPRAVTTPTPARETAGV